MQLGVVGHRYKDILGEADLQKFEQRVRAYVRGLHTLQMAWIYLTPGVGSWAADVCDAWKKPWVAVVPYKYHYLPWPPKAQQKYFKRFKRACDVVFVDREPGYIAEYVMADVHQKDFVKGKIQRAGRYVAEQLGEEDILLVTRGRLHPLQIAHAELYNMKAKVQQLSVLEPLDDLPF
jgi:hypothetical protein